jgi:predicted DCC family thiol-disulfide oxidoreductase YuxK
MIGRVFSISLLFSQILGGRFVRVGGLDPAAVETFMLISGGIILMRSDAAIEVVSRFGGAWKFVAVLRLIPRVARDWVYSAVARNRYRWFGRTEACMIPTAKIKERFLG